MAPIRIQAQALRRRKAAPRAGAFMTLPEDGGLAPEGRPDAEELHANVKRAIAAATEAGLASYRVDIAPDGTISLIVGDPADTDADADLDPYRDLTG